MFAHSFRQFRFAVLGIVLLTVATRLPAILHPLPIDDEAGYAVIANEIVDGAVPTLTQLIASRRCYSGHMRFFEVAGKYNWKALHLVSLLRRPRNLCRR
jgi:hypothetical protein